MYLLLFINMATAFLSLYGITRLQHYAMCQADLFNRTSLFDLIDLIRLMIFEFTFVIGLLFSIINLTFLFFFLLPALYTS